MCQALGGLRYLRDYLLSCISSSKMKRIRSDDDTGSPATAKKPRADKENDSSEAAKFNLTVLRKLQRLFAADPETDLLANFPTAYSSRLAGRKKQGRSE